MQIQFPKYKNCINFVKIINFVKMPECIFHKIKSVHLSSKIQLKITLCETKSL